MIRGHLNPWAVPPDRVIRDAIRQPSIRVSILRAEQPKDENLIAEEAD